jgi:hypothetical protein
MLASCEKEPEEVKVTYLATNSDSEFQIVYRDENNKTTTKTVNVNSADDEWIYKFDAEKGDIVYLSAYYADPESSISLKIMIDEKVFRQGYSVNDTTRWVTVSGTIPY